MLWRSSYAANSDCSCLSAARSGVGNDGFFIAIQAILPGRISECYKRLRQECRRWLSRMDKDCLRNLVYTQLS